MSASRWIALLTWAWVAQAQTKTSPELQKAIDEFRLQTRNLGLREDSAVKTNGNGSKKPRWHGRVFENFRNDFLDAVPHEVAQRGGRKNILRRSQFGFNVAGPVVLPRIYDGSNSTFFTFTFEGMREKIGRSHLFTIPTLGERAGDWSATVDAAGNPLPIFDPRTTTPNPRYNPAQPVSTANLQYNREPFPGNVMPQSQLDPVAQEALRLYPAPNTDVGPFFRNNYFIFTPEINSANGVITRVDHNIRQRHRLGIGINYSKGQDGAAPYFTTLANSGGVVRDRHNRRASVEHVFTASPQAVNTLTFDLASDKIDSLPETDADGKVFPKYRFSPYLSMGHSTPEFRTARHSFALTDGFSWRRGAHRLRFTGQVVRERVNVFAPQYPEGAFTFSEGLTSLPGIVNTGHAFASFVLGQSEFAEQSLVASPSYFRRTYYRASASDQWELRKGLTFGISLGLNMSTPRVEKYDRQSTVSLTAINPQNNLPGALIVAGLNGQGRAFQPFLVKAEPSASLAWNVRGSTKTVVRLGYSRGYSTIPIYSAQWGTQAFNGIPTWISPNPQLMPAAVLSQGLPPTGITFPDTRPDAANNTVADLIEPTGRQPTYQSASLSLERELPGSTVLTLGAGHSDGRNLLLSNGGSNPNAIPLSALEYRDQLNNETFNASQRPYPQYKRFDVYSSWPEGRYQRDAGYLRVEKRTSAGLSVSAYYEFSKQMDDYSGPYGVQDFYNRRNEWALTAGNNPQRLTLTYNYDLPFGANHTLLAVTDWRRYFVEGWSFSGVTSWASGDPLAPHPMFNNTGGVVDALNVNVVPGVDPHVPNPGPDLWFNPAAFAQPADFTIGNASRTSPTLRLPGSQNHDLALNKRFSLSTEKSVELSMVGLNVINHANWNNPDVNIGTAAAPNVNAGKIIGSHGGRVIQLGLRFSF
ncbi:MAG: hypothetical protein IANPNBLG_03622 [Bryobacteraceae bacterium]|nr:hypothetical protein [Bryobacteraceae bacterium]